MQNYNVKTWIEDYYRNDDDFINDMGFSCHNKEVFDYSNLKHLLKRIKNINNDSLINLMKKCLFTLS